MLHMYNIYHLEISPDNILVVTNPSLPHKVEFKLTNFFMSSGFDKKKFSHNKLSSLSFMSGERLMGGLIEETDVVYQIEKCDIYSLGCILYLMLAGSMPFTGKNLKSLVKSIRIGKFSPLPLDNHF